MKNASLLVLLALGAPLPALAIESLDDSALSEQSGQAGLTVSLTMPSSTLAVSSVGLTDTNGITDTGGSHIHLGQSFASSAALFYAPTTFGPTQGVRLCTNLSGACTAAVNPITADIDVGANAASTETAMRIGITLPSGLRRIQVSPFSLYLSPLASGNIFNSSRTLYTGVDKLLEVGPNGLDVTFTNSPVKVDVLFGRGLTTQHMLTFTGGGLLRLGNDSTGADPIKVYSKNGAATASLTMDFDVSATDQVAGFGLTGFYVDLLSTGSVSFGKDGLTDKLNLTVSNVTVGAAGTASSYDSLKTGSMGNIGLVGVQVTDLKIKASGMTGF